MVENAATACVLADAPGFRYAASRLQFVGPKDVPRHEAHLSRSGDNGRERCASCRRHLYENDITEEKRRLTDVGIARAQPGKTKLNLAPCPTTDSAQTRPSWDSIMVWQMDNPSPKPLLLVV